MITVKDEELHPPGADPHWQESFYFNWSTPDGRSFGLTRIGLNHASGTGDAVVVALHDGVPDVVYAAVGEPFDADVLAGSVSRGLTVGALTYTMLEPLGSWRIELAGRNQIDLTWTAFTPAVDFHAGFPGTREDVQAHFEQGGRVEGTVDIDGRRDAVDGLGQRDKSWGVREWSGIRGWDWIAGQGADFAFNATLTDIDGEITPVGFVYDAGEVRQVVSVDLAYTFERPHQPRTATLHVVTDGGHVYDIRGTARGRVPLVKKGLFIEETQAGFEFEHEGVVRTGAGVLEHAFHVGPVGVVRRLPRLLPVVLKAREDSK